MQWIDDDCNRRKGTKSHEVFMAISIKRRQKKRLAALLPWSEPSITEDFAFPG
jgi:hypothetical protein